jgi:octaprenyl-diphosphate synthase
MDLSDIRDLIADDFQATDRLIVGRLQSDVALINQIGQLHRP